MTAPEPASPRREKYQRVLSRLKFEPSRIVWGQPIIIGIEGQLDELCDVTLRLVHSSGRTYVQKDLQLGPGMTEINLGKATTAPAGEYDIVVTPRLGEFFSTTRYQRRLQCIIAAGAPKSVSSPEAQVDQI